MFNRFPTFYNRNTHPRQGYRNFSGAVAGKGKGMSLKTYPASQVFAAAVAAQEHNGEYRKYEQRDPETGAVTARPNKELMREFLEQELTPEQLAEGEAVREHYQRLLFQQMTGELKDFLVSALRVSSRETFANNDWLDLAIVAALPSCYQRDRIREAARDQRDQLAAGSQPVGQVGQRITGEFQVVQCYWSQKWNSWTVTAQQGTNLFFFFLSAQVSPGQKIGLAGTVKGHRDGNVTQLNRVRLTR